MGERTLHSKDFEHFKIMELLGETNLLCYVSKLPHFVTRIILKFYVRLYKDIRDPPV